LFVNPFTNAIPISPMERMTLVVASGWQVSSPTNSPAAVNPP
jgi:hypothetical protein